MTLPLDSTHLSLLALTVAVAFLVETASGFGGTVVALTLGSWWFGVNELLAWLVPVNLALSLTLVARGWRAVSWAFLARRLLPWMLPGFVAGVALSAAGPSAWLKPLFGAFVVLAAALLIREALRGEAPAPLSPVSRAVGLFGAGLAHGLFATGGPLVVSVGARELPDKAAFRATLAVLWVVLNVLFLAQLAWRGAVSGSGLLVSAVMLVPLGAGLVIGEQVHRRLDEGRFRRVVAGLLVVAGVTLVLGSRSGA
jgi:uncharacterized membrane protein YfcA